MGPKKGTMSVLGIQFSSRVFASMNKNLGSITIKKARWGEAGGRKGRRHSLEGGRDFS